MKEFRLEREGIVKITREPSLVEQLESLGYEVVSETEVAEALEVEVVETVEGVKEEKPELSTKALKALLKEKGIEVPANASKAILEDMAKAEGLI